jgi:hypothetical protein
MRTPYRKLPYVGIALMLIGCAGNPVVLGSRINGAIPVGAERTITSEACGFQLLLVIPIKVNDRAERAYMQLEAAAGGDFITDVRIQESWTYGCVGTLYCTKLQGKAIRPKSA